MKKDRTEYFREYRRKNPDKIKEIIERCWKNRIKRLEQEQEREQLENEGKGENDV